MKNTFFRILALLAVGTMFLLPPVAAQQRSDAPLTNASIVKLVRAGFKEKTVIAIIRGRPNHFNLGPDQLVELKHEGVSENIILAMLEQDESFTNADDWGDDGFFNGKSKASNQPDTQSGSTDIFGSSGGSKSQSHGRGASGSNEGEGITTGSATVRILRPPTEAGGAAPKLEKTPTLNNDSIVRLVEAGFSEGTIVKQIEDSPADFDLSPEKLVELRKHRVTETIIAAMTAAMADSDTKQSPAKRGQ